MKISKLLTMGLMVGSLGFIGCTDDEDPVTPTTVESLNAPTNLKANSKDDKSVTLSWTASASETNANFNGYEIRYDGLPYDYTATAGNTTVTVSGLSDGQHVFTVKALSKDTTLNKNSAEITIAWAPAWRFTKNINDEDIVMYEYTSTYGSGLNLFDEAGEAPKCLKVASIEEWTVGISTKNDGEILFGPAAALGLNGSDGTTKYVQISSPLEANSIDDIFDSEALSARTYLANNVAVDLANITTSKAGVVFYVKETLTDGSTRYAKLFIYKGTNGWLNGSGTDEYVKVGAISYQKNLGLPYAKVAAK
ncbi:MAG: fibronectin type III domain-containing protein [Candidatus Kapabacteria bacterium]|nr:fibronectin type III domain-containing protein [Candidatus Kapabacteria bacterium]